jgi:hypothetical protein
LGPGGVRDVHETGLSAICQIDIAVPDDPQGIELCLVDASGEVIDCHVERHAVAPWRERILPDLGRIDSDVAAIHDALQTGEGQFTEFKEFIEPGDAARMRQVPETVVAFANTTGGLMVIGIDDHGALVGVERGVAKLAQKNGGQGLDEATELYVGMVRKAITDAVNHLPPLQVGVVEVNGHTLVVAFIQEGSEKPYLMQDSRDIYVRHGANNVKPTELELRALFERRTTSPAPTLFR